MTSRRVAGVIAIVSITAWVVVVLILLISRANETTRGDQVLGALLGIWACAYVYTVVVDVRKSLARRRPGGRSTGDPSRNREVVLFAGIAASMYVLGLLLLFFVSGNLRFDGYLLIACATVPLVVAGKRQRQ